jgi:hypothetical protein
MRERGQEPDEGHERAPAAEPVTGGESPLRDEVLSLQRAIGNRATSALLQLQGDPRHHRGHAGEQGAGFHFYRYQDGWAVVRGPGGSAGHGVTKPGEDGLMFNIRTKELHIVDNKSLKAEGNVSSATAIDPQRNLRRNLRDMIRYVRSQSVDALPMRQEVLSRLTKTWAAIDDGRKLPARVSLVVTNYGGRSSGITERLARQGVTFRDVNDPLVVRPGTATPPVPAGTSSTPSATSKPAPPSAKPPAKQQGSTPQSNKLMDVAKQRAGKKVKRHDQLSGGRTTFPRSGAKQTSIGVSKGPHRQAVGVVIQSASNWASDKSLNHAVATQILHKWEAIESWRAQNPNDYIVFEVWIQEADIASEAGTARMVEEVNAYHGPTIADVERQIAAAGRLSAPPSGWHLVGPYMGWIEPHENLDKLREKVENEKCFIATACCGSESAPEVVTLRAFRDRSLQATTTGRALMRAYYRASPAPARVIARHPLLRAVVRRALVVPAAAAATWALRRAGSSEPVSRPRT